MRPRLTPGALLAFLLLSCRPLLAGDFEVPDVSNLKPPPRPEVRRVDLLDQFVDPSTRRQCEVSACHAFGSMAVLEAAYKRRYKTPIRFSEAYVFLKRTLAGDGPYRKFCATGDCDISEYNDVPGDVRYAVDHGAPSSLDYDAFLARYRRFRGAQLGAMKEAAKSGPDEKARRRWAKEQTGAYLELEKAVLADPKLAAEVAASRSRIGGFTVVERQFDAVKGYAHLIGPEDCRKRGLDRQSALSEELDAGRPAAVGANLTELKAWRGKAGEPPSDHAFVIVGYTYEAGKGYTYHTRNSWGGHNPDFLETELCRVDSIVSVLTEDEARR